MTVGCVLLLRACRLRGFAVLSSLESCVGRSHWMSVSCWRCCVVVGNRQSFVTCVAGCIVTVVVEAR
eukprot:2343554-Pyramimonas_sp.AAC.1